MSEQNSPSPQSVVVTQAPDSSLVNGLAVTGIVLGGIGLLGSFVPCFGMFSLILLIPGLILGGASLYLAKQRACPTTLPVIATVLSGLGTLIAIIQILFLSSLGATGATLANETEKKLRLEQERLEQEMKEKAQTLENSQPGDLLTTPPTPQVD